MEEELGITMPVFQSWTPSGDEEGDTFQADGEDVPAEEDQVLAEGDPAAEENPNGAGLGGDQQHAHGLVGRQPEQRLGVFRGGGRAWRS